MTLAADNQPATSDTPTSAVLVTRHDASVGDRGHAIIPGHVLGSSILSSTAKLAYAAISTYGGGAATKRDVARILMCSVTTAERVLAELVFWEVVKRTQHVAAHGGHLPSTYEARA